MIICNGIHHRVVAAGLCPIGDRRSDPDDIQPGKRIIRIRLRKGLHGVVIPGGNHSSCRSECEVTDRWEDHALQIPGFCTVICHHGKSVTGFQCKITADQEAPVIHQGAGVVLFTVLVVYSGGIRRHLAVYRNGEEFSAVDGIGKRLRGELRHDLGDGEIDVKSSINTLRNGVGYFTVFSEAGNHAVFGIISSRSFFVLCRNTLALRKYGIFCRNHKKVVFRISCDLGR